MNEPQYYEIQSNIDPRYGAIIYPLAVYDTGAGYTFIEFKSGNTLTTKELKQKIGIQGTEYLISRCRKLYFQEN